MKQPLNFCLACGACCAHFRASFYYQETDEFIPGGVPAELTEPLTGFRQVMRGTKHVPPRCVALNGAIGQSVACSIHVRRASVCREFPASYEDGVTPNERCDQARAAHGLPPVRPEDWWTPDGDNRPARIIDPAKARPEDRPDPNPDDRPDDSPPERPTDFPLEPAA